MRQKKRINKENFDKSLKYASSIQLITGIEVNENELLCSVLKEIENCCEKQNMQKTMEEFKEKCLTLGRRVKIIDLKTNSAEFGLCTDIKNDGRLVVKKDTGEIICVNSGEVSVRGIYGEDYV